MTRKFDQPFVQVTCWIPFRWMELWISNHPQFQDVLWEALRKTAQEQQAENTEEGKADE